MNNRISWSVLVCGMLMMSACQFDLRSFIERTAYVWDPLNSMAPRY